MAVFELVGRYFWLVAIALSFVNAATLIARSRPHIESDPDLAAGYRTIALGTVTWMNIPWVVMGIGILLGGVPSVWYFFRPRDGNPFVLAWFASVFALWLLGTYWLFLRGGAELLASVPGATQPPFAGPAGVKLVWALSLAGGIAGVVFMWFANVPLPPLR